MIFKIDIQATDHCLHCSTLNITLLSVFSIISIYFYGVMILCKKISNKYSQNSFLACWFGFSTVFLRNLSPFKPLPAFISAQMVHVSSALFFDSLSQHTSLRFADLQDSQQICFRGSFSVLQIQYVSEDSLILCRWFSDVQVSWCWLMVKPCDLSCGLCVFYSGSQTGGMRGAPWWIVSCQEIDFKYYFKCKNYKNGKVSILFLAWMHTLVKSMNSLCVCVFIFMCAWIPYSSRSSAMVLICSQVFYWLFFSPYEVYRHINTLKHIGILWCSSP